MVDLILELEELHLKVWKLAFERGAEYSVTQELRGMQA